MATASEWPLISNRVPSHGRPLPADHRIRDFAGKRIGCLRGIHPFPTALALGRPPPVGHTRGQARERRDWSRTV